MRTAKLGNRKLPFILINQLKSQYSKSKYESKDLKEKSWQMQTINTKRKIVGTTLLLSAEDQTFGRSVKHAWACEGATSLMLALNSG